MKSIEKPILSISLLVSNRIDTITKCMESIKPFLEQLPCELIAVDTVGEENSDGSLEVVRRYTDKIYRFEWCKDFAAARNCGFEKCTGEWFLFLDDDEWFEDVSEIINFFTSGEYKNYSCAFYKQRNYTDRTGKDYSDFSVFRMIKKEKGTCFEGRIHEYLIPFRAPAKEFLAYVHHYGYVFDTEEEKKKHRERNVSLLLAELEKRPGSLHLRAQLLQEYIDVPELRQEAERLCEETFRASEASYQNVNLQWMAMGYVKLAAARKNAELVKERATLMRSRFPLNAMVDFAISYMELEACSRLEQYEQGIKVFQNAMECWRFVLLNPEKKQSMLAIDIEMFFQAEFYCEVLRWGIYCYRKLGNEEQAIQLMEDYAGHLQRPIVSVFVLVSNRIATIQRCMESIQPFLKAVPSELIVVDTVGEKDSDGSLKIAREYATKIVSYPWDDDFAAARNAALREAKGQWVLYLDDDEWFEDTKELQRFFMSGEYLEYYSATYLVRNYKDKSGTAYTEEAVGRMTYRQDTTVFVGCVSETFRRLYAPMKHLSDFVHHYGYVYDSPEERRSHLQYVRCLLEKSLERYPEYLKNRARLTAVLALEHPARALEVCLETIELCSEEVQSDLYQKQLVLLFELFESLQTDNADRSEQYQSLQEKGRMFPLTEQAVCYRMARSMFAIQAYEEAYVYAKRYFALEEEASRQQHGIGECKKYQAAEYKEELYELGAACASCMGAYADAWSWYGQLPWEEARFQKEEVFQRMLWLFEENANVRNLIDILKRVMKNTSLMQKATVRTAIAEILALLK